MINQLSELGVAGVRCIDDIVKYLADNNHSRITLQSDGGSILRDEYGGFVKTFENLDELYNYIHAELCNSKENKMNKKFIEFVEKYTFWTWRYDIQKFRSHGNIAEPEDLLGWQIAFADKCGYIITVSWNNVDRYEWEIQIQSFYKHNWVGYKTYQEAFDAAWEKFIELIEA